MLATSFPSPECSSLSTDARKTFSATSLAAVEIVSGIGVTRWTIHFSRAYSRRRIFASDYYIFILRYGFEVIRRYAELSFAQMVYHKLVWYFALEYSIADSMRESHVFFGRTKTDYTILPANFSCTSSSPDPTSCLIVNLHLREQSCCDRAWSRGHGVTIPCSTVDSIISSVRYIEDKPEYGSIDRVPGVLAVRAGHDYTGY